jgi:Abortive infection C-terminus
MANRPPLNDSIIVALACLVDDSQTETREPSHSDIEFQIERSELSVADPAKQGRPVGKAKRVRAVLSWALDNSPSSGEAFVANLISTVRGYGGFRAASANYCGEEAIINLADAFFSEGWELLSDGTLQPRVLDSLKGVELTKALEAYASRARKGALDSPLLAGTAKDLLEATAAHVLVECWGTYPSTSNFPTLLGQAFTALGLATPTDTVVSGEPTNKRMERASYELACALNALRNREGTGHGRPWIGNLSGAQANFAIEAMGNIAMLMLDALRSRK